MNTDVTLPEEIAINLFHQISGTRELGTVLTQNAIASAASRNCVIYAEMGRKMTIAEAQALNNTRQANPDWVSPLMSDTYFMMRRVQTNEDVQYLKQNRVAFFYEVPVAEVQNLQAGV